MKVLFATTNPAKVQRYTAGLEEAGIEVLTIKDLGYEIPVDECGKNAIENALIKAKAYYDKTKMICIGMDNNLFIEDLPEEKQPGNHVRRINGKTLSDDEMIEYYTNLVKENGGKLTAKWVYGMVVYDGKEAKSYSWSKEHFYFIDTPCQMRNPGYPLDSITIIPEYNRYLVEFTDEERKHRTQNEKDREVGKFLIEAICGGYK